MKNFSDWYSMHSSDLPWLVIGKGPSFSKISSIDLKDYQTIALNHAVTKVECDIFHLIDLDVLDEIEKSIEKNAKNILIPYYPHVDNKAGSESIEELLTKNKLLKKFDEQNRLLWYNSSTSKKHKQTFPIITVRYFSADAVVSLLVSNGAKKLVSVGVDGGSSYNQGFSNKTLLSNTRASFNAQFVAISKTLENSDATFIPLGEETIRIYVGTQEEQWLATKVLEFSIISRTSASIELIPLHENKINIPQPKDKKNAPRTPFSFQRFLIPELADFNGKAIYLDSDMQVFTDIRDLYNREFIDTQNLINVWDVSDEKRIPQFSVMLLDCKNLKWDIKKIVSLLDNGTLTYEQLMFDMALGINKGSSLEKEWNSLEYYDEDMTKLLHFTDMSLQPWLSKKNTNSSIWISDLIEAVQLKFISKSDIKKEILLGNIRPSLLYQINTKLLDARKVPFPIRIIDTLFNPPHRQKYFYRKSKVVKYVKGAFALNYIVIYSLIKNMVKRK